MALLVATGYENCVLWIDRDRLTGVSCVLHQESICDTRHVELGLTLPEGIDQVVISCDLIEAQDGGVAFLHVNDLMRYGQQTLPDKFAYRRSALEQYIGKHYDFKSPSSELRVTVPTLYDARDIVRLYELVLPNFYGFVKGFRFVNDKLMKIKQYGSRNCTLVKTSLPDVYRVEAVSGKLPGNKIAYIGSASMAQAAIRLFDETPSPNEASREITCEWMEVRQKWRPILSF